ncbi:MAG TPA: SUMF1/EgtB/PvdO family nonheme iron enzyme [Candidatus Acidoferrales bacterium]|nr:SUMF1/EgtB/PvdO family nonheme iron enzyme [Candidatus Acidoferrales bacterium]
MATFQTAPKPKLPLLLSRIEAARKRTDDLFKLLPPHSLYDRSIQERHRLIFYLGHLEAFDWNLLAPRMELRTTDAALDKLFAFGIDPLGGGLPTDVPADWPAIAQVEEYNRRVRDQLNQALQNATALHSGEPELMDGTLVHVAIEHRLMHAETLAYLLHNLPFERKLSHPVAGPDLNPAPRSLQQRIPSGIATLGQARGNSDHFGWDNEFDLQQTEIPSFLIDIFPITNHEYLKFVRAGGYEESRYWRPEDWEWKRQQGLEHPHFWIRRSSAPARDPETEWEYRGMFGAIPLPPSWPVYVSYAEANAFARWAGKKLPTEAQWHRAAYGTPQDGEREYPWGRALPDATCGNFDHESWEPTPVDAHPAGASAFGVHDLLGNGWEWTATTFGPLAGFEPFSFYHGYSADFFDGKHFVMKGGSARTDACMLRRSYRNWFQPHYPYIYATFRCVEE